MAEGSDVSVSQNEILAHFQVRFNISNNCLVQGKNRAFVLLSCRKSPVIMMS